MDNKMLKNILLSDKKYVVQKEYWDNKLFDECEETALIYSNKISEDKLFERSELSIDIPSEIANRLIKMAKRNNLSLYIILTALLKLLVFRYTSNNEISVWSPVNIINYKDDTLNNLVLLRDNIDEDDSIKDLILKVRNTCIEAYKNQDYPIDYILEMMGKETLKSKIPHSNILCMLNGIHDEECIENYQIDVVFSFIKEEENIKLNIQYNKAKYELDTIKNFYNNYLIVLSEAIKDINSSILEIECTSDVEKRIIKEEFNCTSYICENNLTISQLFEKVAQEVPEKIALVGKNEVSYKELNERANNLAWKLREIGANNKTIIAIKMNRTEDLIVAIIGVLKSGAAYLPIDIECPTDRMYEIISDAKVSFIIEDGIKIRTISKENYQVEDRYICINDTTDNKYISNLDNINDITDLAYVIYTSGSTGKPKGVMIEHKSAVNLLGWFSERINIKENNRVLQLTNVTFDVSVEEIFGTLLYSGTLFIPSKEIMLNRQALREYIANNKINVAQFVPVTLREFIANGEKIKDLNKIISGGDRLDNYLKDEILELGYNLYNNYGPTEATVDAMSNKCDESKVTLGKPVGNTRIYILNSKNKIQPIGALGEMCIAGSGLARGYLGNEELTNEKFVKNIVEGENRVYKTGDIGRWLPNGQVEFLGRIDNQVKVRGFRIEIEEIEFRLKQLEYIKNAVIKIEDNGKGDKALCAYIVSDEAVDTRNIKEELAKVLPDYMIPTFWTRIDEIPLNQNGKIDKKKLVRGEKEERKLTNADIPKNKVQEDILNVWKNVLGEECISIRDSFFELGGDSIKAIQIVSGLLQKNLSIDIKDIFKYKNILELSNYVKVKESDFNNKEIDEDISGEVKLTAIQKWFFERNLTEKNHWNNSMLLFSKDRLDKDIVLEVFRKIINHHDTLRMVYEVTSNGVRQNNLIYTEDLCDLKLIDLMDKNDYKNDLEKECNKIQDSIDLGNGPLIKPALINTCDGDYLLIVIHHLVIDGVSWRILLEDFEQGYKKVRDNEKLEFQHKTASFKSWADSIYKYSKSSNLLKELDYWKEIEKTKDLALDKDMQADTNCISDSEILSIKLSNKDTESFIKDANKSYNTEANDILITALGMTIKKWAGKDKILINLEGHGREDIGESISVARTIGWFTSMYPVVINVDRDNDLAYTIKSVKEQLRGIPNKGIGYGILRYVTDPTLMDGCKLEIEPDICFNYLGQLDREVNTELFSISKLSTGNSISLKSERVNSIEINGMIVGGELTFTCSYNKKEFRENTIKNVMDTFKENLLLVINHCVGKQEVEVTPTDLGYGKLSIDELDKVMNILNMQ